ncbi:MAG TPA: SGNH/GDSL hydrolase family protein [Rhizomicrobium sp.]|nr:SGNH/GDSL hydrolase family protein [Rhizomicrobium sp.]
MRSITALLMAVLLPALLVPPAQAQQKTTTILFVGNSFTYGADSAARYYKSGTVTDLNGPGTNGKTVGGVPAFFKAFTREAGLDYTVSLEAVGGKGMDFHYAEKRALLDKPWDVVVMHGYSTLDQAHPNDPALLIASAKQMTGMFRAQNPRAEIWLSATWSRADQTYPEGKPWHGKPIQQMGKDIAAAYDMAAKTAHVTGVVPVGLAWNRAIDTGVAGGDPYAGIPAGKINLWTWDGYHASAYGYYLEALLVFAKVTGRDPLSLGDNETVADDMGFSKPQTHALQQIAHDELAAGR